MFERFGDILNKLIAGNVLLIVAMSDKNNTDDEKAGDIIEGERSACATELRKEKRTHKTRLTRLHTRLVRLMS